MDVAVGGAERLHPMYFLAGLAGSLRQMVGGYAVIGYLAATGRWRMAVLLLVIVTVATFVGTFLHWRRFEYRVGAQEIRIDSGILSRTHRSIPFDRIQDVNVSQGLLARLLGIARVEFETGGSAGDKDDDGALAGIPLARAEAVRNLVRARRPKGCGLAVPDTSDASDAPALLAMDLRRVLLAGVFNFSLAVIAGLLGVAKTIGDAAGLNFLKRRFWRQMLEAGSPVVDLIMAHQVVAILAGVISLTAIGLAAGIARTVLRDFRFRLDRTTSGLRRRRGLLTVTDVTLPILRVQAAIIGSGPVRAKLGWSDLKLQSLAKDEGTKGDHVVAPLARDPEVAAILNELGWRFPEPSVPWTRSSSTYAWSVTALGAVMATALLVCSPAVPWISLGGVIAVAVLVVSRWLCWHRFGYVLEKDRLLIRSGWWQRRLIILPLTSIQSADVTENFVSRYFGTAAVTFGVASGRGYSSHHIPAVLRDAAFLLRMQVLRSYNI
ncbi:PH domain-containing protein [Sphingomonas mucosissima]|uniref:PH domain-containing protein n=1 Tax=Sphingomonas mucosissima TaxID=370959 RepID=UPI00146A96DD|nr:PH domain-containing protein [Sphingomonas mucosissima]